MAKSYKAVKISKGSGGWGGPLTIQPTEQRNKVVSVTGGGIHPIAQRIAELTGAEAVDGFKAPPIESEMAVVAFIERFHDAFVELAQTIEFLRLHMQTLIQATVFQGRRCLSGDRRQESHVLAAERFAALFSSKCENRDRSTLRHAGDEVVNTVIVPGRNLRRGETPRGL